MCVCVTVSNFEPVIVCVHEYVPQPRCVCVCMFVCARRPGECVCEVYLSQYVCMFVSVREASVCACEVCFKVSQYVGMKKREPWNNPDLSR
jgi:hypothetical protein